MRSSSPRPLLRSLAALVLLGTLLAACGGPPAASQPTAAPVTSRATSAPAEPTAVPATAAPVTSRATSAPAAEAAPAEQGGTASEEQIKAGIQQALDLYAQAYNDNNPELLKQAADQTNLPFRRFIQTRFETYQESIFGGQGGFSYSVKSIRPRDLGFYEAQVENQGGAVADWTFREVNGAWVMAEPTKEQLGKREKIEGEHFTYYSYAWAEAEAEQIMELMESARVRVFDKLGKVPDEKADVYINPSYSVGRFTKPGVLAYYDSNSSNPKDLDKFVVAAPRSYVFQAYDPSIGWEKELEDTLTHEYAHLVNNRSFTPIARLNDWMVEGLAEFVADSPRPGAVGAAVSSGQIIPIIDPSDQVNKQDLEHLTILEKDVSLAYGLSYELVAYINETYGGMEGFWKLADAYDRLQKFDPALQEAFGVSYEQFDKDWRAWLEAKY